MARKTSNRRQKQLKQESSSRATNRINTGKNPSYSGIIMSQEQQKSCQPQISASTTTITTLSNTIPSNNETAIHQQPQTNEPSEELLLNHPPNCSCLKRRPGLFLPSGVTEWNVENFMEDDKA